VLDLWREFKDLMKIATSTDTPTITAEGWTERARAWATVLVSVYDQMEVTPYLHVFVYHLGFFLVKCDSLEKFANYSIENKHQVVRKRRKGNLINSKSMAAKTAQILLKDLRDFVYDEKVEAVVCFFSLFSLLLFRSSFSFFL